MGNKLKEIFYKIQKEYGEIGLYRLVVKTKISLELANELEDSDFNIKKVNQAISDLGFDLASSEKSQSRFGILRRILTRN